MVHGSWIDSDQGFSEPMLRYMHPEFSGPIEKAWKRYTRKARSIDLLRGDMKKSYGPGLEWFNDMMYPRLRRAVRTRDYPAFGVHMSFSRRLCDLVSPPD